MQTAAALILGLLSPPAFAQSAMQTPVHYTAGPSTHGYFRGGYLTVPTWLDAGGHGGVGYEAGQFGIGIALHVGFSRIVYADVSFAGHLGAGHAATASGERDVTATDWLLGGTLGARVLLAPLPNRWHLWTVVFTGFTRSSAALASKRPSPEVLDPAGFHVKDKALSSPFGLYVTFGAEKLEITLTGSVAVVWTSALHTDVGDPPTAPSDSRFGFLLSPGGALEATAVRIGMSGSATLAHTPAMGGCPAYTTLGFRWTWALRVPPPRA